MLLFPPTVPPARIGLWDVTDSEGNNYADLKTQPDEGILEDWILHIHWI